MGLSPASFKNLGFGYRQSRNEMLEDKRPAGFQPQRAISLVPTGSPCARQRREQSRTGDAASNLPVDRLCSIYAAGDPFTLADEVPGRPLRDSAPLW